MEEEKSGLRDGERGGGSRLYAVVLRVSGFCFLYVDNPKYVDYSAQLVL